MIITIPHKDRIPQHDTLILKAMSWVAEITTTPAHDRTIITIDRKGEPFVTQADFDDMLALPCTVDEASVWIEQPFSILDNLVSTKFPDCITFDENDEDQRRIYSDYSPWHKVSNDGLRVLIRCLHVKVDEGFGHNLDNDELLIWDKVFGNLLCRQSYDALMLTDNYKTVDGLGD